MNPIGPRACYDDGKRCAEALAVAYATQYAVDVRIARIFNTYGPRMHENDGRVVSNFIVQALQNRPITVHGRGEQTRAFCYVDDLIRGFTALMASDVTLPVNLGNPGEFTVKDLAKKVIGMTGSKSPSNTCRSRSTIQVAAAPTSHARKKRSAGNRRSCWTRASRVRSSIFGGV